MSTFLTESFNLFGTYGPIFLIMISMNLLWNKDNLFFYYIVGVFSDAIINLIIKGLIQQPRPSEDIKQFNLALTHGKRFLFKDGIPYDIFGMPSGHVQSCFFSTTFIYLSLKKNNTLYVYLIISLLVTMQRVIYNYHTLLQVIIGSIFGTTIGYLFYILARNKITGHITEKQDDYGPI